MYVTHWARALFLESSKNSVPLALGAGPAKGYLAEKYVYVISQWDCSGSMSKQIPGLMAPQKRE